MENLANNIPTIDLSVFFRDGDEEAKKAAKESLGRACAEYGFFLATNHGIPSDLMSRAMELCQTFFGLADEEKLKNRPRAGGSVPAGYTKQPEQSPDKNEVMPVKILRHTIWIVYLCNEVLTNEKFKSALHRVTRPKGRSRYSISFFYNLQGDKLVEPFPHFTTQIGEPPKYKGFLYKDYQALRIKNKINPPYKEIGIDYFAI
ncbi:hypothetical protein DH2020_043231 [Rehmannia glutinosa]|uniref:Uncharacterized protein n=1 Tax=Rehmannia glutinosa TaxID=99300 RepID=A0ABR0UM14_REHGL